MSDEQTKKLCRQMRVFDHICQTAQLGAWIYDIDEEDLTWTDEVHQVFETNSGSFQPDLENMIQLFRPHCRATFRMALNRLIKNGETFDLELEISNSTDETTWIQATGICGSTDENSTSFVYGMFRDISEIKKLSIKQFSDWEAIERAQEEATWYRMTTDIAAIVAITDRRGVITHVNEKFEEISGYSRVELLGKTHQIVNSGIHPPEFFRDLWATIARGEVWRGEICNKAKTGSYYWVHTTIVPLKDHRGRIQRYASVRFDITELKRLEHETSRQALFLSQLVDMAPVGIYRLDQQVRIAFVNQEWERIASVGLDEVVGMPWLDSIHPQDRADILPKWLDFEENHESFQATFRFARKDSTVSWVSRKIVGIKDQSGQIVEYIGTSSDITELQKTQDELYTASKAKTMFLANISHEIRTPLNAVIGFSQLLSMAGDAELLQRREEIQQIETSGNLLLSIINDVLDFSKIEAGNLILENGRLDIRNLVESTTKTVKPAAEKKNLRLSCEVDASVPIAMRGDELRITQILLNFLSNAVKFTDVGAVVLRVRKEGNENQNRSTIVFEVIDSGIGITSETLAHLFMPFTQADSSFTRRFGGTGLGLVISKKLAELMDGTISVDSVLGEGSKFSLMVALELDSGSVQQPSVEPIPQSYPRLSCLLVEDNAINQRVAGEILKKFGLVVVVANNGLEAVERLRAQSFDIVFMDLQMPVMGGIEAAKEIRSQSGLRQPWIIALTANAFEVDRKECLDAGMNDFLPKPIRVNQLEEVLKQAVAHLNQKAA